MYHVLTQVFTVTVGPKPSHAEWFVQGQVQVEHLLAALAEASEQ